MIKQERETGLPFYALATCNIQMYVCGIVTLITIVVVVAAAALNLRNTCWPPQMIDYISMPQPIWEHCGVVANSVVVVVFATFCVLTVSIEKVVLPATTAALWAHFNCYTTAIAEP